MKTTNPHHLASTITLLAASLLLGTSAGAAISGVYAPDSLVQFKFDDTTSLNSSSVAGTTNYVTTQGSWGGNPLGLNLTDPITADTAGFTINGYGFVGPATVYRVNIPDFHLTQPATGSGYAEATLEFHIEYQVDGSGFTGPLIAPQFVVNGSVLTLTSLATVSGHVSYYSLANGLLETLNYGYATNTPGLFSQVLTGTPVNNLTSLTFAPNDRFIEAGFFKLHVDPASITFSSFPQAVPEPSTVLFGAVLLGALATARHRGA